MEYNETKRYNKMQKQAGSRSTIVTGGDSELPWGTGGYWIEPWSEEEAQETVRKLDKWWHRREIDGQHASADADSSESLLV